jgi:hypothetical protein
MKNCKKCGELKSLESYPKDSRLKDGRRNVCKSCVNKRFMEWKSKSNFREYQKEHYENNKESIMETNRRWLENNREYSNAKQREKYKNDINFRLKVNLRNRLYGAIKIHKNGSAVNDLGCTIDFLKDYLESKFEPGMSWDNHGDWHIDHIIPLSSFDLTDRSQLKKACHYSNLQPLWAFDNISKSNNII